MTAAWLELLRHAVEASSMGRVAEDLDVGRPTISLVLAGKYPARTDRIAQRVINVYGRVQCPFLGEEITGAQCRDYHTRAAPTSSPFAMRHWRACQSCPHRRES